MLHEVCLVSIEITKVLLFVFDVRWVSNGEACFVCLARRGTVCIDFKGWKRLEDHVECLVRLESGASKLVILN